MILPKCYSWDQNGINEMEKDYQKTVDFYKVACD